MKKSRLFLLLTLALLLALVMATAALAQGNDRNFTASLKGRNEVPPVDSNATGNAIVRISKDETSLSFKLIAANIDGVTQAHIHCGIEGANGGVTAFLFGRVDAGVSPNGILSQGTIEAEDVLAIADSPTCPGGIEAGNLGDLIDQIRAGNTYVNVHTLEHPPGEIRGQLD